MVTDSSSVSKSAISRLKSQRVSSQKASTKKSSSKKSSNKKSSIFSTVPKELLKGVNIKNGSGRSVRAVGGGNIKITDRNTKSNVTTTIISNNKGQVLKTQVSPIKGKDVMTKQQKQRIVQNVLTPGRITLRQRLLTPTKKDSGFVRAAKGAGTFIAETSEATVGIVKKFTEPKTVSSQLGTQKSLGIKALQGDKKAKKQLKKTFFSIPSKISAFGAALGSKLQSPDPFLKVQGLLTIATLIGGPKIAKTKKVDVLFSKSKYSSKVNLASKSSKSVIKTTGTLEDGTKFKAVTTLRHNPAQKTVIGQVKTTVKGKVSTQKVNLKDLGTTFVDAKTRKPIAKDVRAPSSIKYNIDELKTTGVGRDSTRIAKGDVIVTGKRKITRKKVRGEIVKSKPKPEVIRTKQATIDFATDFKGTPKDILTVRKNVQAQLNKLKKKDLKNLKAQDLKALEIQLNKKIRTTIKRKGTAKAKGEFEQFGSLQVSLGPTRKLKVDFKPLNKTRRDNLGKIPKTIDIPKLKSRIKLTRSFKTKGMLSPATATAFINKFNKKIKQLEKSKLKTKAKAKVQPQKKKVKTKSIKKAQAKKKVPAKKAIKKVKQASKPVSKSKPAIKTKVPIRVKVRSPRIKVKTKLKVPTPIIDLNFNSKLPNGQRLKFDMRVRIKGKVRKIRLGLPLNKALRRAGNLIDKTTARSMDLIIAGATKIKDINKPKVANKFRQRRTKKVLTLVEKSKHAIDTRGEKKGLTLAKALKPKSKKKKKRTVKVVKKTKKSSNKKRKQSRKLKKVVKKKKKSKK